MQDAGLLFSRVAELEQLVQSLDLTLAQPSTGSADHPVVSLHITSDILLTKGNNSIVRGAGNGLPRNINLNIALNDDIEQGVPSVLEKSPYGKFLINSTVSIDRGSPNEQKNVIKTEPQPPDGIAVTEKQVRSSRRKKPLHC